MGTSFTLFRLFDIDVRVHWSFALILAYGAFNYGGDGSNQIISILFGILTILLLFVCVTLHEFGHALVAQYYKIRVPHITLLPIGGVASLEKMPEKPVQEFFIAIAGPLVNFVISILLLPVLLLFLSSRSAETNLSMSSMLFYLRQQSFFGLIAYLFVTNIMLGVFNLLPAFPMDGGRILRSLLALILPYVQATKIAVLIGRIVAAALFLFGIFSGSILTMLIAFFVYAGGGSERRAVVSRAVLGQYSARDLLEPQMIQLYTSETLARPAQIMQNDIRSDFPVFDLAQKFVGVLTREQVIRGINAVGGTGRVVEFMTKIEEVPVCKPSENLAEVWETMAHTGSRVVAVKEGETLLGILSTEDINQVFREVGRRKPEERSPEPTASASSD